MSDKANRFRFRAWNKTHKFMDVVDGYDLFVADGELCEVCERFANYASFMDRSSVGDSHILMQSTGLLDANGVECFEGDRLGEFNFREDGLLDWATWVVVWRDGAFYYIPENPGDHHEDDQDGHLLTSDSIKRHPVIGNIHENPELLEAAQ